ncbi:MAG: hypothetical protein RIT39_1401 [Bacteroidota bacterium]
MCGLFGITKTISSEQPKCCEAFAYGSKAKGLAILRYANKTFTKPVTMANMGRLGMARPGIRLFKGSRMEAHVPF